MKAWMCAIYGRREESEHLLRLAESIPHEVGFPTVVPQSSPRRQSSGPSLDMVASRAWSRPLPARRS